MLIKLTHWISDRLLDNAYMFNLVRYILAGKQTGMRRFVANNLNEYKCNTIADFCCGTGDFAVNCPPNSIYYGWDLNSNFIKYARKKYHKNTNKKFLEGNVLSEKSIYSRNFDAVLLISAMHHLSNEELSILLPKIKKITRKVFIIADIIPDPPHFLQRFFVKIDRGRYIRHKEDKLKILKKYFKIINTESIPTKSAIQFGIVCETQNKKRK